jgi:large subunit ribosomal protein L27
MVAVTREPEPNTHEGQVVVVGDLQAESATSVPDNPTGKVARNLTMGRGYAYREANWEIGRLAEKSNVRVNKFVPGDRFTAWKRSKARIDANAEKKRLRSSQKATKPKAKKR